MYKTKVIFFLLLASLLTQPTFAQHISAKPNNALRAILRGIDLPENTILEHYYTISSPFAQHFSFRQTTLGKEVKHHGIKVHLKHDGSYSVQDFLSFAPISSTYTTGNTFVLYNNELQAASKNSIENSRRPLEQWVRSDGLVLLEVEVNKFVRKDTAIFGKVFNINPINSSGQPYGGSFVDNNDQTNGALDSQLVWRELPVIYHNDTFLFESEFMYFKDISAPLDTFFYVFSDSLAYTRDIGAFEFVNAYYHINTVGKYVNKLGYDELTEPLAVDVHAFDGWDNSAYTPGAHTLQFGDGGIDDAEDGEVIIHEFAHSLSELASPNNTVGSQREAMEEGSCDYFAKAYSRSINDNTPNKVFTWDGNEFWNGFKINTKRIYPQDLKTSKDGDRDMWSSALMCAHDKIGRVATDSLLLEHFYYQAANTTMTQMAQIILDIDSADFNKRYFAALKQCFVQAGFIKHGASIAVNKNSDAIKIFNQQGFAAGTAPIEIVAPSLASFSLYGASGAKIHTQKSEKLLLSPDFYEKGMYVIRIETSNAIYTLKVIR